MMLSYSPVQPWTLSHHSWKRITDDVSNTPSIAFSVWIWLDKRTITSCEFA